MLSKIPSVDEFLKSRYAKKWFESYPRQTVLRAVREVLDMKRKEILKTGLSAQLSVDSISQDVNKTIEELSAYKLKPLINATGIVIHTNLGRAVLSDSAIKNIQNVSGSYSNLEYDLYQGKRGSRYGHIKDILRDLSGSEDAVVVNNNAAAVLVCLNTFASGMEVVVSRGELVEIGGSFRIPEVMRSSGAVLREVGTTNKTHLSDYENAVSGNAALLLKVHQSNYKLTGFTGDVPITELVQLGKTYRIPVMTDLGSGCMIDLEKYGIYGEPRVRDVVRSGVDIVTFSGDKLLGGPQAGIILGRKKLIRKIQANPLLRALRMDKLTLASLEATFMQYIDEEKAVKEIPTVRMLTQSLDNIKRRAKRISASLKKDSSSLLNVKVTADHSRAGGGSLPEINFPTFVVSVNPLKMTLNLFEKRLRSGTPPVIARIRENSLLIDARTVQDNEVNGLIKCITSALSR